MTTGRPTKLTPELQAEMVNIIRGGNYVETACAYVGLNKSTFYDWMKRGARELDRVKKNPKARVRKDEQIYVEFSNAIKKAEAEAEARDVLIIGKAAETQWQAAAWRLERRLPKKWGRHRPQGAEVAEKQAQAIADMINSPEAERALEDYLGADDA